MADYRLTSQARTGFRSILIYVEATFGPGVAERVLEKLITAFQQLADRPGLGHRREALTKNEKVQFWSVGPTLIAYRAAGQSIEILLVERGERDWQQLLGEEHPAR